MPYVEAVEATVVVYELKIWMCEWIKHSIICICIKIGKVCHYIHYYKIYNYVIELFTIYMHIKEAADLKLLI